MSVKAGGNGTSSEPGGFGERARVPSMTRRCVFVGDEVLTVQCAELAQAAGLDVVAVVSAHPYALEWAVEQAIPTVGTDGDLAGALGQLDFDILLSVANLRLIPERILAMADTAVNFHDGPLPGYAGLNAPNWAILDGRNEHAITWHLMDSGVDTGDIISTARFPIEPTDTAFSLNARCYEKALETFPAVVDALLGDDLRPEPQTGTGRRVHRRHERPARASLLDPSRPAAELAAVARALDVGPQRRRHLGALRLVLGAEVYLVEACHAESARGEVVGTVVVEEGLRITTIDGDLVVTALVDVAGRGVEPAELVARRVLVSGSTLTVPPPELGERLAQIDPAVSRSEDRVVERLTNARHTVLPSSGRGDGGLGTAVERTSSEHQVGPTATVELPGGCGADIAVAAVATWLARRNGTHVATFELVTPALAPDLLELSPLVDPPHVSVEITESATLGGLAAAFSSERERAERDGVWLRDLVARDPVLRAATPEPPEIRVTLRDQDDEHDAVSVRVPPSVAAEFRVEPSAIVVSCAPGSVAGADLERFADEIRALLGAAFQSPSTPVRRLPMLSAADLSLLHTLNDTAAQHDEELTIDRSFRERVAARPDVPAVSCGSEQLTYAQLGARVDDFVRVLRAAGVGAGCRVGVALPRGVDMLVTVLATLECGGAYVPLDPEYPDDRLAFMVADADLRVVVHSGRSPSWLRESAVPVIGPDTHTTPSGSSAPSPSHTGSDLAYVIYTSGSTGHPKGVMLEHRQVTNFFLAMDDVIGPDPGVWLAVTSLSFDISVLELLWTLTRGFHVVIKADPAPVAPSRRGSPTFSLFHFAASEANDADGYRLLLEGAALADRSGFEAVWIPERHFHEFGGIYPNPAVLAAAVAATTENVRIRAGSCVVPLHHPARVAEEWAVVDNLSGGRVGLAAAAGWQPNDFVLRPESYADNKAVMLESLDVIARLWRGEEVPMEGPSGTVPIRTLPRPVQAELPIWITSAGNVETFEIAGRRGHRLLTHLLGQSIEQLAEKIVAYRTAWREAGHPGDGHVTLMLHTYLHDDGDVARTRARPHLRDYLRSATGLLKDVASSFPTLRSAGADADDLFASLDDEEMDALLDAAVDRYVGTSGLFGDVTDAMAMVEEVTLAGADEIACLVDFGIGTDDVLASLPLIARLKARSYEELGSRAAMSPVAGPAMSRPAGESAADLIRRHGCTHLQCTPSLATMLVADPADRDALRSIRHMLVGGEALPTALAAELRSLLPGRLTNMYGPTETTIWSLVHEIDTVDDGPVPIGRPIANTTISILDDLGELLPPGSHGELHIGGAGVARGYHDRPELTAERFVEREGRGRMYATGDVVRLLPDGVVEFAGRSDFQVKVRGHRIELGEVEALLDRHPDVTRAVVTAPSVGDGVRLVAYVLAADGRAVETDALRAYLADRLPAVMVPEAWVVVPRLPLTPNGKIDRRALPDPALHIESAPVTAPAADERERMVASVWEEALGRGVGRNDNFFDVGGHSLLAVKVFRRMVDHTGFELSLTDVFRYPTVGTFAGHLASLEAGGPDGNGSIGVTTGGSHEADAAMTGADRGALRRRARRGQGRPG